MHSPCNESILLTSKAQRQKDLKSTQVAERSIDMLEFHPLTSPLQCQTRVVYDKAAVAQRNVLSLDLEESWHFASHLIVSH